MRSTGSPPPEPLSATTRTRPSPTVPSTAVTGTTTAPVAVPRSRVRSTLIPANTVVPAGTRQLTCAVDGAAGMPVDGSYCVAAGAAAGAEAPVRRSVQENGAGPPGACAAAQGPQDSPRAARALAALVALTRATTGTTKDEATATAATA